MVAWLAQLHFCSIGSHFHFGAAEFLGFTTFLFSSLPPSLGSHSVDRPRSDIPLFLAYTAAAASVAASSLQKACRVSVVHCPRRTRVLCCSSCSTNARVQRYSCKHFSIVTGQPRRLPSRHDIHYRASNPLQKPSSFGRCLCARRCLRVFTSQHLTSKLMLRAAARVDHWAPCPTRSSS